MARGKQKALVSLMYKGAQGLFLYGGDGGI